MWFTGKPVPVVSFYANNLQSYLDKQLQGYVLYYTMQCIL